MSNLGLPPKPGYVLTTGRTKEEESELASQLLELTSFQDRSDFLVGVLGLTDACDRALFIRALDRVGKEDIVDFAASCVPPAEAFVQ